MKMSELVTHGYGFAVTESRCVVAYQKTIIFGAGDFDNKGGKLNNSLEENIQLAEHKATQHYNTLQGLNHEQQR